MRLFVLQSVSRLTNRWHSDGGLAVVARDRRHAEGLIASSNLAGETIITVTDEEWLTAEVFELKGNPQPRLWAFPDAGCC